MFIFLSIFCNKFNKLTKKVFQSKLCEQVCRRRRFTASKQAKSCLARPPILCISNHLDDLSVRNVKMAFKFLVKFQLLSRPDNLNSLARAISFDRRWKDKILQHSGGGFWRKNISKISCHRPTTYYDISFELNVCCGKGVSFND